MNNLTRTLLWVLAIILLNLGIWPIAFIIIITLIISAHNQKAREFKEMKAENQKLQQELATQELKTENQRLRQELDQAQAVQRAMEKAEKKGKED